MFALDAAGHGKSEHRSPDASYNIWQDLGDLLEVTAALDWPRFSLLGHSRGAAVATLFAGSFPERVDRLLLLEGGLPLIGEAAEAPENLARVLERTRELRDRGGRVYASRDQAIAERVGGFSPVSTAAAEILARRSLNEVPGGWQWQVDQRLKAGSEFRLTRDQVAAFIDRISAPTLCVLAKESPFAGLPVYQEMLGRFAQLQLHEIAGRHHLHLEGAANEIAAHLLRFLELA